MLNRVGGGFTFNGWIEDGKEKTEPSELSKITGADLSIALYGSNFEQSSHIVGYAGITIFSKSIRTITEIIYFEEVEQDLWCYLGTSIGKTVHSKSSSIPRRGYFHSGVQHALGNLLVIIESFDKNISEF